jgi:hypothetical protein
LQAQYDCIHPHPSVSHRAYRGGGVQSTVRGTFMRWRASCVARTWMALSVDRMCASWPGWAPKAPFFFESGG